MIEYADRIRSRVRALPSRLGALGLRRTVLLSVDHRDNVRAVARGVGIGECHGELSPDAKVSFVRRLEECAERVVMIGDGTNDAPALSTATVGVALASGGAHVRLPRAGDRTEGEASPGRLGEHGPSELADLVQEGPGLPGGVWALIMSSRPRNTARTRGERSKLSVVAASHVSSAGGATRVSCASATS
ncbi:MAG TPA: HAD-IC family P-type ATPase [Gemmatimonadales bacterium]|nr:HAD-IC family P-type ATPase [Gemmatimonadales bacterium]